VSSCSSTTLTLEEGGGAPTCETARNLIARQGKGRGAGPVSEPSILFELGRERRGVIPHGPVGREGGGERKETASVVHPFEVRGKEKRKSSNV